jgi:hypothetical protein
MSAGGQHPPPRVLPTAEKIVLHPKVRNDVGPARQPLPGEYDTVAPLPDL